MVQVYTEKIKVNTIVLLWYAVRRDLHSFPTRRSSDLKRWKIAEAVLLLLTVALVAEIVFGGMWPTSGDRYPLEDRKSTRLNSSHPSISYAVFCLKKKNHRRTCAGPARPRGMSQRGYLS